MVQKKSFWSTLPGILTGITSVLVAAGGFVGVLYQLDLKGPKAPPGVQHNKELAEPVSPFARGAANTTPKTQQAIEPVSPKSSAVQGGQSPVQVVPQQPTTPSTPAISKPTATADWQNFQKLHARVLPLKFFASEAQTPPSYGKRSYSRSFVRSQARYICWELEMVFPETSEAIKFYLERTWLDPKGEPKHGFFKEIIIKAGTNRYLDSGGWRVSHDWEIGAYRVVLKIGDQEITQGMFKLEGP